MVKEEKLITTDYIMAFTASVVLRLVMQYKVTLIPLYMLSLGMTKAQAGFAMTVFTIFALILRPLNGILIDKYGRRTMLSLGIIIFAVSTAPFGVYGNMYFLYLMQALSGISFSIQSVALTTIITDIVPEKKLTQGLGYFGLTATITQALGPFLAVSSVNSVEYFNLFLIAGIFMISALIFAKLITYESKKIPADNHADIKESTEDNSTTEKINFIDKLVERKALLPSALMGCLAFTTASTTSFLVPFAQAENIGSIGGYFIARAAGITVSRLFADRLESALGRRKVVGIGIIEIIIGVGGICLFRDIIPLMAVAFFYGMGFGLAHVLLNVSAVKNTPKNRRAYANATFYLMMDAGIGIGSVIWGTIGDYFGLANIFLSAAIFAASVFVWFLLSKIK